MPHRDVEITTPDGTCWASLDIPEGPGPWPAVIMYADAGGLRPLFESMGGQLASLGYVVLVPDVYYRSGDWAPFDLPGAFRDPHERQRLHGLMASVTYEVAAHDAQAFADYLLALPETSGDSIGTTGYCMGGRLSLVAAGHLGAKVGAAASFHGGGLVTDTPGSPHRSADQIRAMVYVAGAAEDRGFTDEHCAALERALTDAGVAHMIETYPARHGFAVPDSGVYDEAADKRHWDAMVKLYGEALPRPA